MTILKQGYRILHLTDLNFVKEDILVINNLIAQLSSQANSGEDLNFQSFLSIINAVELYKLLGYAKSETDVYRLNLAMLK